MSRCSFFIGSVFDIIDVIELMNGKRRNMNDNIIRDLKITDITEEGNGLGRNDGKVTFVRDALPGEIVDVRITHEKKKYDQGEVLSYKTRSDKRREPFCPHFGVCGGCALQHLDYEAGLLCKSRWVRSAFSKIGRVRIEEPLVNGMKNRTGYRNKVTFHGFFMEGVYKLGFYRKGSNSFVPIEECHLVPALFLEIKKRIEELSGVYNVFPDTIMLRSNGEDCQINLECGVEDNLDLMLCDLRDEFSMLKKNIFFSLGDLNFEVSSGSFFQVNLEGAEHLLHIIEKMAGDVRGTTVYDLCCGVGSIGIYLGSKGAGVRGYEVVEEAVELASKNAKNNKIADYSFVEGKIEDVVSSKVIDKSGLVILDPPRGGVETSVIESLIYSNVERIIYVGCGLGKMARDMGRLSEGGFVVSKVECVDMFPWTSHVETIVRLQKS